MNTDIRATLETMNKDELVNMLMSMGMDRAFGVISRNMAETFYTSIESGKTLIMIDIANMHAMNHKFNMNGVDTRIKNVTDVIRHSDLVIRWGGDELVIVLNSGNVADYLIRLDELMAANDLYAVYGVVTTSESLSESVARADEKISATKLMLEVTGQKPDRNAEYVKLNSVTVYE
jgi:diguanylate cyclase (GGDEF)-like protein